MEIPDSEDQIDAIVGAALKAMAESGAGRARLGAFAAAFRNEVEEILGRKPAKAAQPDLLDLVTKAVRSAIADPAINQSLSATKQRPAAKEKATRFYVVVAGKATSVTVTAESMAKLGALAGDYKKTRAVVQQLAESAPPKANRSRWIQDRLIAFASSHQDDGDARH